MTVVDLPSKASETPVEEALFKEARRRRIRRWSIAIAVLIVLGVVLGTLVSTAAQPPKATSHPSGISIAEASKIAGIPVGPVVSLKQAGPLVVGPTGALFVVDQLRHEVLVRLPNRTFRAVAGDGKAGFSGDGGRATRAELSSVSDITFAPDGKLYLADDGRVRGVDSHGVIQTVVGNGKSPKPIQTGMPASSARLGSPVFIAFNASGVLYLTTGATTVPGTAGSLDVTAPSQLLRLDPNGMLDPVMAIVTSGPGPTGKLDELGSVAADDEGNVYVSSLFDGWSVYEIAPSGVATNLGYARRSGGNTAVVQAGPNGVIDVDDGPNVMQVQGDGLVPAYSFYRDNVPSITDFIFVDFFTLAPNGSLYADNLNGAFDPYQQIVSVVGGRAKSLWRGPTLRAKN